MMRKIRIIVLMAVLVAALLALLLPWVLKSDPARAGLAEWLSFHLESEISISSIEFAWLPVPHLLAREIGLERPGLKLQLAEIHVFPRWWSLLSMKFEPERVLLQTPSLVVDPGKFSGNGGPSVRVFPRTFGGQVEVRNGTVVVAANQVAGKVSLEATRFTDLRATLQLRPESLEWELSSRPSFGEHFTGQGSYEASGTYRFQAAGRQLRLHELVTAPVLGRVSPLADSTNLNITATGRGLESIDATLIGELPSFLLTPEKPDNGEAVRFDGGFIDLALTRQQQDWQLLIGDFELEKPAMQLAGKIARHTQDGALPQWEVDLNGRRLDAAEIRTAVLALFGESKTAQYVGNVVRSGWASRASFRLAGPENELRDPLTLATRMVVEVEVDRAEIMVPVVDLYLPEAHGFLRIENGILELRRAEARLGRSRGRDGSLSVGLLRTLPILKLDLELDADLEDLREILPDLIRQPVFQAEMARFSQAAGTASGRLVIGDSYRDFEVAVTVKQVRGELSYDRLPWLIKLDRGRAFITREEVNWHEVAGTVGPHRLGNTAGQIALSSEAAFILEEVEAVLAAAPFFDHLRGYPVLEQALTPILTAISGDLAVRRGRAAGELFAPEHWRYTAAVNLDQVTWLSPLLATEVTSPAGHLEISDTAVVLREVRAGLEDSSFTLDGKLRHQLLRNWQGDLGVTGRLQGEAKSWLRQRDWLPELLLPRPPITIAPLVFHWEEGLLVLSGNLQSGEPPAAVKLEFEATARDNRTLDLEARLSERDREAELTLRLARGHQGLAALLNPAPAGDGSDFAPVAGHFRGTLNGQALGRIFSNFVNHLEWGTWRGDARFQLSEQPAPGLLAPPVFTGELLIEGLSWYPDDLDRQRVVTVNTLDLAGQQHHWQLRRLDLSLTPKEQLELAGEISAASSGFNLELDLFSSFLRRQALTDWREDIRSRRPGGLDSEQSFWPLGQAEINFHLAEFVAEPDLTGEPGEPPLFEDEESEPLQLVWGPLRGHLSVLPTGEMVAELQTAVVCCLEISGTWYSSSALGTSSFFLAPACPTTPRFEELLPCFGIEQDIIIGDCLVEAELHGEFSHWQDGRISISSPEGGRILRLRLLSRILSLINLTDIFTGGITGLDEKGFAYRLLEFEARIANNQLTIERAVVRGEGLNLIARGILDLSGYEVDMVVLVAPFKTIDTLVSWIPFVGRIIGGRDAAIITIPVGVKGDIREPALTVLAPDAVGEGLINLLKSTLMLPFNILSPILPESPSNTD